MIPIFRPYMPTKLIEEVGKTLSSGWWTMGPKVEEFEGKFAYYTKNKYAVAMNSATAALDLSVKILKTETSEIFCPALTFISTAYAGLYNNLRVNFVDVHEETLNFNWDRLAGTEGFFFKKEAKPIIIPVHYGGRSSLTVKPNKAIIEDCAHAAGNKTVGKNLACWSFHAVKNLPTGDGGMITTSRKDQYERLKALRWCGINKSTWERERKRYGWDYNIKEMGYKCHMNDITATIGICELETLDETNATRRAIAYRYNEAFADLKWLKTPPWDSNSSWHMYVVRVPAKDRDRFIDYLLDNDISAGVHYKPLYYYPMFNYSLKRAKEELPVTYKVWKQLVTLPLFPDLTQVEVDKIILTVKAFK